MYFYIDCIASIIFIAFFLLSCLQVVKFEKSITLKLVHGGNPLEAKDKDNLVEAKSLLFATNSAIDNLSNQSFY